MSKDKKKAETKEFAYDKEKGRNDLKVRREVVAEKKEAPKPRKALELVRNKLRLTDNSNLANPALLEFPTDRLGITREIKKAFFKAGSRIGADKDTLALIDETVRILRGHLQARYKQNVESPRLRQRVDTRSEVAGSTLPEDEESSVEASKGDTEGNEENVSYHDMQAALKEADVKPKSRSKEDVEEAYNALNTIDKEADES